MQERQQEERHQPEEEAAHEGRRRAPAEGQADPSIPDPSGDTEITESDRENPLVNDSSMEQSEKGGRE